MIFDWFRKPHLTVQVLGADIVVTMPDTSCRVGYTKTDDNKLIASTFTASKVPTEQRGSTFAKFLGLAWAAANATVSMCQGPRKRLHFMEPSYFHLGTGGWRKVKSRHRRIRL